MKIFRPFTLILVCTLSVMGCAAWKIPTTVEGPPLPPARMNDLVSRLTTQARHDTLKAMAQISINHATGKYTRRVALLAKRPSSLRIEAIPLFGPSDFFMSAGEGLIRVFLPTEGRYYVSPATRENLARFFKIPLPLDHMVSLLTGTPPIAITDDLTLRGYSDGEEDRMDVLSEGRPLQSIWLDRNDSSVRKVEVFRKDGNRSYTATFGDFIPLRETNYPRRLRILIEGMKGIDVTIRYIDLEMSQGRDLSPFDLPIPSGIEATFLD